MNDNSSEQPPDSLDFDQEPATQPVQSPPNYRVASDTQPASGAQAELTQPATNASPQKPKSKTKQRLMLGIAGAIMLVLLGGGTALYALWYQNPDRIVGEAMINLLSADNVQTATSISSDSELMPGVFNVKVKQVKVNSHASSVKAVGEGDMSVTLELNGRDYKFGAKGRFIDNKTAYFQLVDIQQLLSKLAADFGSQGVISAPIERQLGELQNRWVKVSSDELGEDSESFSCFVDTTQRLVKDQQYVDQLKQVYRDNNFIEVGDSLGSKDGNLGYKIKINQKEFKDFLRAQDSTKLVAELKKCPGYENMSFDDTTDQPELKAGESKTTADLVVWVSRFGHQLRQVDYSLKVDNPNSQPVSFSGKTELAYDEVKVEVPNEWITLEEWQTKVEKLSQDMSNDVVNQPTARASRAGLQTQIET